MTSAYFSFIYLFFTGLGLCCCAGFSLTSGALPRGAQASPCLDFLCCRARARGHRLQWLRFLGSAAVAHGLSCSATCGFVLDQGSNLSLLCWQAESLPLEPPGKANLLFLIVDDRSGRNPKINNFAPKSCKTRGMNRKKSISYFCYCLSSFSYQDGEELYRFWNSIFIPTYESKP